MRYVDLIGSQDDFIERKSNKPKYYPCPHCGRKGKRKWVVERHIPHAGALHRRSFIVAKVGVYKARCTCCKYFQASIPGVPYKGRYSYQVRNTIANALIRDRMPYQGVINRMREEYLLDVSVGYVHNCFVWAHEQINTSERWGFVCANFSGLLCIDEVHDGDWTILFATDPLNDFTVSFKLVEQNDQDQMNAFLQDLKDLGLKVEVVITDGSPLYKDSLQHYWKEVEHQLCIFHVIKEVNKLILNGVRAVKNRIKRQGNKGRKKRPGRPSKKAQQQRERRKGMTKKEQATFIWEHQYLIVRKAEGLTDQDKQDLELMFEIAPELKLFRQFNHRFYRLFQKGISKQTARYRRTQMIHNSDYQANPFLAKALKKLAKDKFEKMIVFMGWENVERTNNHVERNNRNFRMLQKTRYKRRKKHTIQKALELDLYQRMMNHPLYQPKIHPTLTCVSEPSPVKLAA
ncbi:MAG: transposase [Chloroflexi bacterium]|nr:transposase [Chloroflexota bacterium]